MFYCAKFFSSLFEQDEEGKFYWIYFGVTWLLAFYLFYFSRFDNYQSFVNLTYLIILMIILFFLFGFIISIRIFYQN